MQKKVFLIVVTYNGERFVPAFFSSLLASDEAEHVRVVVVDNASHDSTLSLVASLCPLAYVIRNEINEGFALGNNQGIRYAFSQGATTVMLANQDLVFEKKWLTPLVSFLENDSHCAAVQPQIMMHPDTARINSCGNALHILGFGFTKGYLKTPSEWRCANGAELAYCSGAAVLLRKEALEKIGLFDESFFMYHEDSDLSWRFRLAGYSCKVCTDSIVYHHYEFSRSITKFYYMERNRFYVMLKNYSLKTLFLLLPLFLIWEVGMVLYSLFGWIFLKKTIGFLEKMKSYGYFLSLRNWNVLSCSRRAVQKTRCVSDREIMRLFTPRVEFQDVENPVLNHLANPIASLYWMLIRKLI